jgi:U3 small nucleolar RNA-associated protein 18
MYTAGDQADIYQWDLRMRKCLSKVADEGAFHTTAIDITKDGTHLATGSKMGTVNIFSIEDGQI